MATRMTLNKFRRGQKRHNAEMDHKLFNDSVLGVMSFHPLLVVVIDTHHVQRLRHIRQLGACYFVFPSACHNRFEHSLGTAFIAGKLFDSLKEKRIPPRVENAAMWEKQKLCVQIAALCHDIGHGPFSHTWEHFRRRVGDHWNHEEESVRLLDELLKEKVSPSKLFDGKYLGTVMDVFRYYGLNGDDVKTIKRMISGQRRERDYLLQVVSNKISEVDVDKWEYISRDSVMLNIPVSFDFNRIINYCCIVQNDLGEEQICFREKECPQLLEMFISRGKLHDTAYKHTKVKIIEEMLVDAFEFASAKLKLTKTPITQLTDHVFQKILYETGNQGMGMQKAKEILQRIESRHLYKCLAQQTCGEGTPDLDKIKDYLRDIDGIQPYIDDIGMTTVSVDMTGPNMEKPLKNVCVYTKKREGQYVSQPFDWDQFQDSLKPPLENLKRSQILLLYKGRSTFPEELEKMVVTRLKDYIRDHVPQ